MSARTYFSWDSGDSNSLICAALASRPRPPMAQASSAEDQDRMILNCAIVNGALELLPDTLASMAIIPLQMKLVYRIGKSYGYKLDRRCGRSPSAGLSHEAGRAAGRV